MYILHPCVHDKKICLTCLIIQGFLSLSVKIQAMVFINKFSAATLFLELVRIRDIEVMTVLAIIFKILPGAWPIRDMEDSYLHVTTMVNDPNLFDNIIKIPFSIMSVFIFGMNIKFLITFIDKVHINIWFINVLNVIFFNSL